MAVEIIKVVDAVSEAKDVDRESNLSKQLKMHLNQLQKRNTPITWM